MEVQVLSAAPFKGVAMIIKSEIEKTVISLNQKLKLSKKTSGDWFLSADGIKRQTYDENKKKSFQRFPKGLYRHMGQEELTDLMLILNYESNREKEAREKFSINTAYLPKDVFDSFHELLKSEIPSQESVKQNMSRLKRYFIDFFSQHSPNPVIWNRHFVPKWANWLTEKDLSIQQLKTIVQISNRFLRHLHKIMPERYPLMEMEPFSRARLKRMKAEKPKKSREYIPERHIELLRKKLPPDLMAFFNLLVCYGLRRGECLFLKDNLDRVRKSHLVINKQLKKVTRTGIRVDDLVKDLDHRKVPHWYMTPQECYNNIQKLALRSPVEYARKFSDACEAILGVRYVPHDCRHTFITNAVNKFPANDVRLAVGHEDLTTLSGYLRDHREDDDEVFRPV